MQLRTISFLAVLTLAAGACGTAATDNVNESVDEARKKDGGCRPTTPGEHPCAKGGSGDHGGQGKSDAGKGHSDADDDDDDDDDDDREDGGKK